MNLSAGKKRFNDAWVLTPSAFVTAMVIAWVAMFGMEYSSCVSVALAADEDEVPSDMCYRSTITVENSTLGDLSNILVRATFSGSSKVAAEQMTATAWDLVLTTSGLQEVETFITDMDTSTSSLWFRIDSLANGETKTFYLFSGNNEQSRDQGFIYNADAEVSVTAHSDFEITDEIRIKFLLLLDDATAQDANLVSHWAGNQSYGVDLVDVAGTLNLQVLLDSTTFNIPWDSSWTGEKIWIDVSYDASRFPDTDVDVNGSSVATNESGLASLNPGVGQTLWIGRSLDYGMITETRIQSNVGGVESMVCQWGFDPVPSTGVKTTQTSSAAPLFSGTSPGYAGGSHDANWSINEAQSGVVDVNFGPTSLTSSAPIVTFNEDLAEFFGDPFVTDFSTSRPIVTRLPFYSVFLNYINSTGTSFAWFWAMLLGVAGVLLTIFGTIWSKMPTVGLVGGVIPFLLGFLSGVAEPFLLSLFAGAALVSLGVSAWRRPQTT